VVVVEEVIKMIEVLHKEVQKNKEAPHKEAPQDKDLKVEVMRGIEEEKEVEVAIDQDLEEEIKAIEMTADMVGMIEGAEMTEDTEVETLEIEDTEEVGEDLKVEEGGMIEIEDSEEEEDLEEILVKEEVQNLTIIQEFFLVVSQVMKMMLM